MLWLLGSFGAPDTALLSNMHVKTVCCSMRKCKDLAAVFMRAQADGPEAQVIKLACITSCRRTVNFSIG